MSDEITGLSSIDNYLKDNQTAKGITSQFERSASLVKKIKIGTGRWETSVGGRRWIQPIKTEPGAAYTRVVGDARPDAGSMQYKQAIYNGLAYISHSVHFDFDADSRAGGTGASEAWATVMAEATAGGAEAVASEQSRQTFTSTGTGTLCGVAITTGAAGANIITLTDVNWEKVVKRDYVTVGQYLDVFTASSSVATNAAPLYTNRKVTAITPSTSADASTITLDGAAMTTVSAGAAAIAVAGNRVYSAGASTSREITGLPTITDNTVDTTVGGLTSAISHRWRGNIYDGGNALPSNATYMAAVEMVASRFGQDSLKNMYAFADITRFNHMAVVLANSTNQAVRYGGTDQIEAKFTSEIPLVSGTTLVPEAQAPPGEINIISLDHLEYITPSGKDFQWAPVGGNSYVKWDDNYGMVGMCYSNVELVTDARGAHVRISNVL